jgi:Fur family transcriptional regulator, iron response regulator
MDAATTASWIEIASEPSVAAATEVQPELTFEVNDENFVRHRCVDLLRQAGLRPTRQRLTLGEFLFSNGGRHVTAEMLHAEVTSAGIHISLATVYNTLNQLTDAGLLRQIGVDGSKSYFDTNPTTHHHFFVDHEDRLLDIPEPGVLIDRLPQPLPGYEISRVDVIVHLRRKQG